MQVEVTSSRTAGLPQRRIFPRWRLRFVVHYGMDRELFTGDGHEISEGGMIFSGERLYPSGTEIELHYQPDLNDVGKWFKVRAVVRHVVGNKMGAEFLNMGITDRIKLLQAIRLK